MPPPSQSLDPRERFKFGERRFRDYFNVPSSAPFDPAYSPQARQTLLGEEIAGREEEELQRNWAAQDKANELLDAAPFMRPRQVERELLRDPRVLATPEGQSLDSFLQSRARRQDEMQRRTRSDDTLANGFMRELQDPVLRQEFQRQYASGVPFQEARDRVWAQEYNQRHEVNLAEAGVPVAEFEKLKVGGRYDPVQVAQRITQAKQEASGLRRGATELDRQMDRMTDAIRTRQRVLEARGDDPAADPLYMKYSQELDTLYGQALGTGATTPAAGGGVGTLPPPPGPGVSVKPPSAFLQKLPSVLSMKMKKEDAPRGNRVTPMIPLGH